VHQALCVKECSLGNRNDVEPVYALDSRRHCVNELVDDALRLAFRLYMAGDE
jgi:hypothetical protein